MAYEEILRQKENDGPEALINFVIDKLEAWADTARIIWTQTGSEDAYNQMQNYSALAYALNKALKMLEKQ